MMDTILLRAIFVLIILAAFVFPFLAVLKEDEELLVGSGISILFIILLILIGTCK